MGCSQSRLDEEEAVQICRDRKRFIKQALERRTQLGSCHIAYIRSLKHVSDSLRDYIDEPQDFSIDPFITISPRKLIRAEPQASCLKAGGSRVVTVQERPPVLPATTFRVEAYSPSHHYASVDRIFQYPSSPFWNPMTNSPDSTPPHSSKLDFFWNPFSFSSFDYYGYAYEQSHQTGREDDTISDGERRVRGEEGIPGIEDDDHNMEAEEERGKTDIGRSAEEATGFADSGRESENDNKGKCTGTREQQSVEVSRTETTGEEVGIGSREVKKVGDGDDPESETPGYTVYLNRIPTTIAEVIKDLEDQFTIIRTAAEDVSNLQESTRTYSHHSTLDRLFAWEKKLYVEVRSGARARIAYEKKCTLLRNQDVKRNDNDPYLADDKTRAVIRDLQTRIKVSIHSIEAISERIETLRDQELLPQLLELVHGLTRMWKVMAECHTKQKRTLDEAKLLLLACTTTKLNKKRHCSLPETDTSRLARSALNLEAQLRNWRACFEEWVTSQRSYVQALAGWLLRCFRCDPDPEKVSLTTSFPHPLYEICIRWSRLLNGLDEKPVLDGLDFFAAGMSSLYAQHLREEDTKPRLESMELVEVNKTDEAAEKLAEVAVRVLCGGMSIAVSSLTEFAIDSAKEYSKLASQPEDTALAHRSEQNGT